MAVASHKPRRHIKDANDTVEYVQQPDLNAGPAFPLASLMWSLRGTAATWASVSVLLLVAGLFRWAVSLWPYSGFQAPPMHGDFEAQRHWMELTIHLPASRWYFYDLEWWGLDYPPLTAYHSWLLGKIGSTINPSWFALFESRALDDPDLKTFMRASVILSEYLIYVPAVLLFVQRLSSAQRVSGWNASLAAAAILLQPGVILIDHGHFQYNTVMLGFVVACMACALGRTDLLACVFFVAALGFKQMTLYFAPAIFSYLLGTCLWPRLNIGRLIAIACVTSLAFVAMVAPLLLAALLDGRAPNVASADILQLPFTVPGLGRDSAIFTVLVQLGQMGHRVFPFSRGLFEDKVANFWCALHTFYKLKRFETATLQKLSLACTLTSIFPACLAIFLRPQPTLLPLAFASSAWGFFLFSFQVHEKSVLLPLLPMTLLLAGEQGMSADVRAWVGWANMLASWTMYPLLCRDGLRVPYFAMTLLWGWLLGEPSLLTSFLKPGSRSVPLLSANSLHVLFYAVMVAWHFGEALVPPPAGKPDIWVVLNVLVGAAGFGMCYAWCSIRLLQKAIGLGTKVKRR